MDSGSGTHHQQPQTNPDSTTNANHHALDDDVHDDSYFSGARLGHGDNAHGDDPPTGTQPPQQPPSRAQRVQFRPVDRQQSAFRIRRLRGSRSGPMRSSQSLVGSDAEVVPTSEHQHWQPQQHGQDTDTNGLSAPGIIMKPLPPIPETGRSENVEDAAQLHQQELPSKPGGPRRFLIWRRKPVDGNHPGATVPDSDCYDERIVDFLDAVDPEVATISSMNNIGNSLFNFIPNKWVNRRPTYDLSQLPYMPGAFPPSKEDVATLGESPGAGRPQVARVHSFSTVLSAQQYAVLPNDATLEGWREEDIKLLNDYVRHMLHSRRSKFKQRLKGFVQYASRPLGFFITLYATLITLFGLGWVLFLIGWIYVGERQLYAINVIDILLVVLFNLAGVGLAPSRAIDTYHMIYVAHYHRKTWKLRNKLLLPKLQDHNDLPTDEPPPPPPTESPNANSRSSDLEAGIVANLNPNQQDDFFPVLSDDEQAKLTHHQAKLAKSHTFYKPHETETHHAFPLRLLVAVVVLLDLHSCLQIALGGITYIIDYHHRPTAATTAILCCSITANCCAGLLISVGDRRTRKKDVLERLMKQELTGEAMDKVQKKREKEKDADEGRGESGVLGLPLPWGDRKGSGEETRRRSGDDVDLIEGGRRKKKKEKAEAGRFDAAILGRVSEEGRRVYRVPGEFVA
ncbi:hypothetical protein B0T22DRAFT_412679 [Podospora appendiculata]|uniref:Integral membrane protein n=1 Tax=Podospora appendiculata TaxID=314037 RepID=A0AAE1C9G9_9PEZI|nr:hypothetical protein B0T22DRAFT_412679 [Podospora appendiculata]